MEIEDNGAEEPGTHDGLAGAFSSLISFYPQTTGGSDTGFLVVDTTPGSAFSVAYNYSRAADVLAITLYYPPGGYGAFGLSASGMVGNMVVCLAPAVGGGCGTTVGSNFNIGPLGAQWGLATAATGANASFATASFAVTASAFGLTAAAAASALRIVMASGPVAGGACQQHATSTRYAALLSFSGGAAGPTSAPALGGTVATAFAYQPFAELGFAWAAAPDGTLNVSLSFSGAAQYASFGLSSSGMAGPIVVCSALFSNPTCLMYQGVNWDIVASSAQPIRMYSMGTGSAAAAPASPPAATASGGAPTGPPKLAGAPATTPTSTTTTTTTTAHLQLPSGVFPVGGAARYIFAYGAVTLGTPQAHSSSAAAAQFINLQTGELVAAKKTYLLAWLIVGVVCVAWLGGGRALRSRSFSTRAQRALKALFAASLLGCAGAVLGLYSEHYAAVGKSAPGYRAAGQAACMLFVVLLVPVCRHTSLMRAAGVPFERAVWIHPLLALALYAVMTAHMAGMMQQIGFAAAFRWELPTATMSPLAGVLCWLLLTAMIVFGLLRRRFYFLFKLSHAFFVGVVVLGALHYPTLAAMMAPGLALWVADRAWRWASARRIAVTACAAQLLAAEGVVRLEVFGEGWADALRDSDGGEYCFVHFAELGPVGHPFSLALHDAGRKSATFFIKTQDGGWTQKLAALCAPGSTLSMPTVEGCYGSLQTPIARHDTVLLVCGGIGVTPMLRMIQLMACNLSRYPRLKEVVFAWSVRSDELAHTLFACVAEHVDTLRNAGVRVFVHVHNSGKKAGRSVSLMLPQVVGSNDPISQAQVGSYVPPSDLVREVRGYGDDVVDVLNFESNPVDGVELHDRSPSGAGVKLVVQPGRVNVKGLFCDALARVGLECRDPSLGVYVCGPEALAAEAQTMVAAIHRTDVGGEGSDVPEQPPCGVNVELHVESFEL